MAGAEGLHDAARREGIGDHLDGVVDRAAETAVRACFEQRRKTLRNGLVAVIGAERADAVLASTGIDGRRRGETLSLAEIAGLAAAIG